jgi:hypothetical protein
MAAGHGQGLFSVTDPERVAFLKRIAGGPRPMRAFVARNFLLDEGVTPARIGSYARWRGVANHPDYGAWSGVHDEYLKNQVHVPGTGGRPPSSAGGTGVAPVLLRFLCAVGRAGAGGNLVPRLPMPCSSVLAGRRWGKRLRAIGCRKRWHEKHGQARGTSRRPAPPAPGGRGRR